MVFDIRDYGAVGDGKTLNTISIQKAIDACAANGGGQVLVENGTYKTGTISLKSNIDFHIAESGVILGSERCEDYPKGGVHPHIDPYYCPRYSASCLILAEETENVSITGFGTIDGNGEYFVKPRTPENLADNPYKRYERISMDTPPRMVFFCGSKHVRIEGVRMIRQPAAWGYWIHDCDDVKIQGLTIDNDLHYPNNDGIHVNCSRDVTITDCDIKSSDDSIIVRANSASLKENKPCERVHVSNCRLTSLCGCIRIAWVQDGVMRDCTFSDITMTDSRNGILCTFPWLGPDRFSDEGREETFIENMVFSNITMERMLALPIQIKIDNHEGSHNRIRKIGDLEFRNIRCRGLRFPHFGGNERFPLGNITLKDSTFEMEAMSPEYVSTEYIYQKDLLKPGVPIELYEYVKSFKVENTEFKDLRYR